MPIPTLKEVLTSLKDTDLDINIELKTGVYYYDGIERKAYDEVMGFGLSERVVWSSFNHCSVMKIKRADPLARIALLCGGGILTSPEECAAVGAEALHVGLNQLRYPGLAEDCERRGISLRAYTINEPEDLKAAFEAGLDAVFTNRIDTAKEIRDGMAR
jgi:glycerophosphoryl diester phosphodiesterase